MNATNHISAQLLAAVTTAVEEWGYSLRQISIAADVPQPVLSRWVAGSRNSISLETADRLASALGMRLTRPSHRALDRAAEATASGAQE